MKILLKTFCAYAAIILIASGCATCPPDESTPGIGLDRNDPYMFWICSYFMEANGRWPTNTPDLVSFLQKDYTNMVQEIEKNYKTTKYVVSPDGWLFLKTSGHNWTSTKRIQTNMLNSGKAERK